MIETLTVNTDIASANGVEVDDTAIATAIADVLEAHGVSGTATVTVR